MIASALRATCSFSFSLVYFVALSCCLFNLFVTASVSVSVVHACEGFVYGCQC